MCSIENKPNQHYVQQAYLKLWSHEDRLACLRDRNNIFTTNTRNVASERYFYSLNDVSLSDCGLIRKLFIDPQSPDMRKLLEGWIVPLEIFLHKFNIYPINFDLKSEIALGLKNILEQLYTEIEKNGFPGLLKMISGDLSLISDQSDEFFDFLVYLCFQYFRTKNIKSSVKHSIGEHIRYFNNYDNAFNLIVPIFATLFGYNLTNSISSKQHKCYLLNNVSSVPFITGDQPVINLDWLKDKETTELSLFYPLSPSKALLITKDILANNDCSNDKILKYNNAIACNSNRLLFSSSESSLLPYKINVS